MRIILDQSSRSDRRDLDLLAIDEPPAPAYQAEPDCFEDVFGKRLSVTGDGHRLAVDDVPASHDAAIDPEHAAPSLLLKLGQLRQLQVEKIRPIREGQLKGGDRRHAAV